jgi:coenzyme F420 hydrogenase subunit beta
MTRLLDRIVQDGLCQGCGGCVAAIGREHLQMRMQLDGYLRPQRVGPPSPSEDERIGAVCSGFRLEHQSAEVKHDRMWGPLASVQTGHATDPEVRFRGSSGGVISALALHLVESGKVDFVVQTRADPANPLGNRTEASVSRGDILEAAGSRYAPSAPLSDLETHFSTGKRFAFIGRPCDVAALRALSNVDPRVAQQVPVMISFFCAGVPSRRGAQAVLKALGVDEQELKEFAYRGRGWPGLTRAVRKDGTEATMDYNSSWGTILNRHLQFRCKICPDGTGEFADVVCADAWYGKDGYPDFAEAEGRSLVIARTARGQSLLGEASAAGVIVLDDLSVSAIRAMQPYQYDRKHAVLARLAAMWLKGRLTPQFKGLALLALTLRRSPVWLLRNTLGTYRRISRSSPL